MIIIVLSHIAVCHSQHLYQYLTWVFKLLISFPKLYQHHCLHIREVNGDGLHLISYRRSSFSAITSLQKAEIFRQRLLFGRSTASWSCWEFPSGLRQLTALRIRVILYDLRASVVNKAFILSKIEKDCAMPVS